MQFEPTRLPEVILIRPQVFGDARGFFLESWERRTFAAAGLDGLSSARSSCTAGRHAIRMIGWSCPMP